MPGIPSQLFPTLLASLTGLHAAGIDSGGGKTSGGGFLSHSSVGSYIANHATTDGFSTINRPGLIEVLYPVSPASITDHDGNGLPDGWELIYFGSGGAAPTADADNDGTSNLMEYLAGTNPLDPSKTFRPEISNEVEVFTITIPTITGRDYKVWISTDLQNWTLSGTLVGDGDTQIFQFNKSSRSPEFGVQLSNCYFRIEILIPPMQ